MAYFSYFCFHCADVVTVIIDLRVFILQYIFQFLTFDIFRVFNLVLIRVNVYNIECDCFVINCSDYANVLVIWK